jgi:hypothetical protein
LVLLLILIISASAYSDITVWERDRYVTKSVAGTPGLEFIWNVSSDAPYWISIDPVGDHNWGDSFPMNATTNFPAEQKIVLRGTTELGITNIVFNRSLNVSKTLKNYGYIDAECKNYPGSEINITSCFINTSVLTDPDLQYSISTPDYSHGNVSSLILKPRWILIDDLGFYKVGDTVNISGTTNAPPGLLLTVWFSRACYPLCGPGFEPISTYTQYIPSSQNISSFSVQLNTSGHSPYHYYVDAIVLGGKTGNSSHLYLHEINATPSPSSPILSSLTVSINPTSPSQLTSPQPSPYISVAPLIGLGITCLVLRLKRVRSVNPPKDINNTE